MATYILKIWPTSAKRPGKHPAHVCLLSSVTRLKLKTWRVFREIDVLACPAMLGPARRITPGEGYGPMPPMDDHYTSARDLAILTTALIKEFPEWYRWFSQKEFTFNKITQHNRNQLLSRDESVDGVKTGFTDDAGYCLVASALREDMRLISVVLGAKSANARANENQSLLNYGFRFFESHRLYEGKKPLNEARIWKGAEKTIPLGLAEDLYATIPRRQYNDLKGVITVDKKITAPVKEGAKHGSVKVTLKDQVINEKDLVALKTVEQGNIIRRLSDSVLMMMEKSDDGK